MFMLIIMVMISKHFEVFDTAIDMLDPYSEF